MTKDYFKNPALGAFLSDLQEIIFVNGKRLSYKSICQDAKLTKRNYAKIKTGDNKSIYAYYAVFRIYLHALLERPNRRLLLMVLKALYEALESDFETRKTLNRK